MALLAAPLSAPMEEPWLRAVAGCGLRFSLVRGVDGSGAALDRGLEDLLRVADLPRTGWVARLGGLGGDVAYALSVLGMPSGAADDDNGVVVVPLGRGIAGAAAALVDASAGGARHRVEVVQVDETRLAVVTALLSAGDVGGALGLARLAVLRDAQRAWAVLGLSPGALGVLPRVASPVLPARLPVGLPSGGVVRRPPRAVGPVGRRALALSQVLSHATRGLQRRLPGRLGAALASLLIAATAAGGAAWVVTHRAQTLVEPTLQFTGPFPRIAPSSPRIGEMVATWDRTAQVVLFGGAATAGPGHGSPLDDTWQGALPPAGPWHRIVAAGPQPSARLAGAMAADVTDGYVLLFGGEAAGDVGLSDTWSYAGGWAQLTPRNAPPAGPALSATEPSTGRVLLVTTCCALAAVPTEQRMQTWRWTGGGWTLLGSAPGWVTTASLVADSWDGTVVMVADGGSQQAATFVWDGASWSFARSVLEPPILPGTHPALAYDPGTHSVLDLVTGDDGKRQTWVFSAAHGWSVASGGGGGPAVVGLLLRDPVDGRAMLYGGDTGDAALTQRWFWSGGQWTQSLQPPPLAAVPTAGFGAAVAADPQSGGLVLYGGNQAPDQTWVWSGLSWAQQVFAAPIPPPRVGASMAYDPLSRAALLVGGRLADGSDAADMWSWRGGVWSRVLAGGVPPPTVSAPMAYDRVHQQVVLLVPDSSALLPRAQTWIWDGAAWSLRHPVASPPLRPESSMTWDPATGTVLLAVPCCPGAIDQSTETWTWDGSGWARRDTRHQPPIHAVVSEDDVHARTVLVAACCGGFDAVSTVGPPETWVWDGRDWTRIGAAALPALQDVAALATDAQGRPLLVARVAGAGPRHPLDGLWTWTGSGWTRLQ